MTSVLPINARSAGEAASPLGWWTPGSPSDAPLADDAQGTALVEALRDLESPLFVVDTDRGRSIARSGQAILGRTLPGGLTSTPTWPLIAFVAALKPEQLGSQAFRRDHNVHFAYVAGAMANGIASVELVQAMSRAGMLAFFGAAGLPITQVDDALTQLQASCGQKP